MKKYITTSNVQQCIIFITVMTINFVILCKTYKWIMKHQLNWNQSIGFITDPERLTLGAGLLGIKFYIFIQIKLLLSLEAMRQGLLHPSAMMELTSHYKQSVSYNPYVVVSYTVVDECYGVHISLISEHLLLTWHRQGR